jgi:ABC-type dipeptide/oligopeptide/nickel transport system ATPase component
MKELNQVKKFLLEALEKAKSNQHQYGEEWSAGRQQRLQEAIAIVGRALAKAALLPL